MRTVKIDLWKRYTKIMRMMMQKEVLHANLQLEAANTSGNTQSSTKKAIMLHPKSKPERDLSKMKKTWNR